ncbi:hypothetical protein [Jeongeupia chitinilytica]|uniref:Cell division protein n=1 Tax=Jeongeupia chitinilytica TaxID=1041641 RepID=A0ABQ3H4E3_9NEIS|nr:hypothetical protein [Jeongeupia chitinilytica]GHD65819.1 hypothetical protein GCM10007350_26910 [Jeongeupia chitinilytica]
MQTRVWLVRWLYGAALAHLVVGLALPWVADAALLDGYHRSIEPAFRGGTTPDGARALQVWWMSLFGPTIQGLALWMWALVRIGDVQRSVTAWGWLIAGLLLWAPQDMLVSLRAGAWIHVWVDVLALATMLPPLCWLWWRDRSVSDDS